MPQFAVHKNANHASAAEVPFLLDVQCELLEGLATRVVVPLRLRTAMTPARHLNPVFEVGGAEVVMSTAELAGVPMAALGEVVHSLADRRGDITAALDFLFLGI